MKFLTSLILFTPFLLAQQFRSAEYVSLSETRVYDIEIIVFVYNNELPNSETYTNPAEIDLINTIELNEKPSNMSVLKSSPKNNKALTVPISNKSNAKALVWFKHNVSDYQLNDAWNKLKSQRNITPLFHRAWRVPETPFENPTYIHIDNRKHEGQNNILTGKVTLSKGRYTHFGNSLNLIKNGNMTLQLIQRQQVKSGEVHYFDSPWLASIVKITEYKGE